MFMIVLLFLIIVIWGCSRNDQPVVPEKVLSFKATLPIRGICAIEIVLGHLGIALSNQLVLFPFRKAGILIVGVFFFLSGYGLLYNYETKVNYLNGFLKKRMLSIVIPVILVQLVYILILINDKISDTLGALSISSFFGYINWYVWEIIGLYIVFFLVFRYLKIYKALLMLTFSCIIFVFICYILKVSNPWYGSTFCFPLGVLVAIKRNKILQWCNVKVGRKLFGLGLVLIICFALFFKLPQHNLVGVIFARNMAALAFVIILIIILSKIRVGNWITVYLGRISYEIYLIHPMLIAVYRSELVYINNDCFYSLVVIMSSVILASVINRLGKAIGHVFST